MHSPCYCHGPSLLRSRALLQREWYPRALSLPQNNPHLQKVLAGSTYPFHPLTWKLRNNLIGTVSRPRCRARPLHNYRTPSNDGARLIFSNVSAKIGNRISNSAVRLECLYDAWMIDHLIGKPFATF